MLDPIYKTKDGQTVTKKQLLDSGYDEDRINKGATNGVLKLIGDTDLPEQAYKTSDGQMVTTKQLLESGYSQDRINNGVYGGVLVPEYTEASPKKKVGSISFEHTPLVSEAQSPSESALADIATIKESFDLAGKKKEEVVFGGATVQSPDLEAIGQSNKLREDLKAKGYVDEDVQGIYNTFKDFPEDAKNVNYDQLLKERKENPLGFERHVSAYKWQTPLFNAIREKEGDEGNTTITNLLSKQTAGDYTNKRLNTQDLIKAVRTYIDDPEKQDKIIKEISNDRSIGYGITDESQSKSIQEDPRYIGKGGPLNNYQVIGLQFMEDTDPKKAELYNRYVKGKPQGLWGEEDLVAGYEQKTKNLENIGMSLQAKALEEKMSDLISKKNKGQLSEADVAQYATLYDQYSTLQKDAEAQKERYPTTTAMEADKLMQEATGQRNSALKRFVLGVGENMGDVVNFFADATESPFRSEREKIVDDLEDLGSKEFTQTYQRYRTKANQLVQDDGKINFTAPAIFNTISDVGSEIVSNIGINVLTGGAGSASKLKRLSSLFGSVFSTTYNDYYTQAIKNDIENPQKYATIHTAIEAATELINPDLPAVKKLINSSSTLGKIIKNVTQEQWDEILKSSRGRFSNILTGLKEVGVAAGKNAFQETFEEVAGQLGGNVVDATLFNQDVDLTDGLKSTIVNTLVGTLPMGFLGLPGQLVQLNRQQKYALYEVAQNKEKYLPKLEADVKEGVLSPEKAEQIKAIIENTSKSLGELSANNTINIDQADNEKTDILSEQFEEKKPELSPEETIVEAVKNGNLEGMYAEMVTKDPTVAKDVLLDLAMQKYGIQQDGTESPTGPRDISMKTPLDVDEAVTKVFPDKESVIAAVAPTSHVPPIEVGAEKSDADHAKFIKEKFVKEFGDKGVPKEQMDAAVALMDARAKIANPENPDKWYRQIEDIGTGEFKSDDVKFQGEWKKVLVAAAMAVQPLKSGNISTIKVGDKVVKIEKAAPSEKDHISKFVKDYYDINKEDAPKEVIDRAIHLWEIYGKPPIYLDSAIDYRANTMYDNSTGRVELRDITNLDDFIAEISHAAQYFSGAKMDSKEYATMEQRDSFEYKRPGSVEYDAHTMIEPYLFNYVFSGKKGEDLIRTTTQGSSPKHKSRFLSTLRKYNVKFQENKGALETLENGKKIIHALNSPDFSTAVHEIAHVFESELSKKDIDTVTQWSKQKEWNTQTSELFARGFEKYLKEGKSPTTELKTIFEKAKEWLSQIYNALRNNLSVKLTPEIRKVFDNLFTNETSTTKGDNKATEQVASKEKIGTVADPPENSEESGGGKKPPAEVKVAETDDSEKPSGIKKALVSEDVVKGVDFEKVSDKDMMAMGRKIIDSGEVKPEAIVTKIITDGKGVLNPAEVVALITYKRDIDNAVQDTYKQINEKKEAGEDIGTLGVELADLERQVHDFEVMSVITAQQQSLAFRLRQKMLDREYNVVTQIEKYKANNNGVIPAEVEAKFRELDKQLKEVKAKLAEFEKAKENEEGQQSVDNIKESVGREQRYTEEQLEQKVQEGVESEISKLYEELPSEKRSAADKAIKALEKFRAKIKGRAYESTLGIPIAIADLGAATAIRAIKVGKSVAAAVEIGINRIKKALKEKGIEKWEKENEYRKDLTDILESEGVSLKTVRDKPEINEDGTVRIPNQMLRDLVERGITDINDLTDEVHKKVVKEVPEITKRQVRDAITEYGKKINPTADEIQQQVNTAKRIGRLLSELEDLKNKIRKEKNPSTLGKLTDKERELRRQIKALDKDTFGSEAREKPESERLADAKIRIKNKIDELNRRIKNNDFSKKKPKELKADEELQKLNAEKEKIQDQYDEAQYKNEIKNRTFWQKAEDVGIEILSGLPRVLVASIDLSAGLVQGLWRLFSNPIKSVKAFGIMFQHLVSEKKQEDWMAKIKAQPYYPILKASKLALNDTHSKASVKEGLFISNWINLLYDGLAKVITLGYKPATNVVKKFNPYKASQRAFDGYVNAIRVSNFHQLAKRLEKQGYTPEVDPKVFEKAADFINTTTGRGGLGKAENSSNWLNLILFAPRKVISEIKLFTPYAFVYYARLPKEVRKQALLNFAQFITSFVTVNALIWAARKDWDDEEEEDNFWNMNSSDFMTHKFGNKRMSVGGGAKTTLVFMSRLISGKFTDQYGNTSKLGERYGKEVNTREDLIISFLKGKAAPLLGVASKKLDEKKGLEVDDSELLKNTVVPIWMQDVKELYKDSPLEISAMLTMLSIFGANVRTVDEQKAPKTFMIKDPKTFKERQPTKEEYKKYLTLKEQKFEKMLSEYEDGKEDIFIDVNDKVKINTEDVSGSEFNTWKKGKYEDLNDDQLKELERYLKIKSASEAKSELFGKEKTIEEKAMESVDNINRDLYNFNKKYK